MFDLSRLNLSEKELDELQDTLNNRKKVKTYTRYIDTIEKHKEYVGKCYKERDNEKYIYVLSSKSTNECRCECMCFEFPVKFEENHRLTKIFQSDNAFSNIEFNGIYVEDYPLFCNSLSRSKNMKIVDDLIEIDKKEYFDKMNEYVLELKEKMIMGFFETDKDNENIFNRH